MFIDGIKQQSPVITDAVSYLTKKVDTRSKDARVLKPTIATKTVSTSLIIK